MRGTMKLVVIALLVTIIAFAAVAQGQENAMKPRIAVLDIAPTGVPQNLAVSVTELLSTELVNTKMFEVIERMQVAKILNEQGFQQTGVTDSSAAAEVGKLLNTKRVVIGTLGKLGQKLVVTLKIVDVEKASILFAEKEMANGEDDLVGACEELANKLVFNITGMKIKNRKTARVADPAPAVQPAPAAKPAPAVKPAPAAQPAPVAQPAADPKKKEDPKKKKAAEKEEKDPVRKHSKDSMNELDKI